jgi:predicted P-loop ATPase/GTPase
MKVRRRRQRMYQVLVVGLKGVDSGKTTFSRALLSHLRDEGLNVCGFKPMAGNNIWYDYDVVARALSTGRLYGRDAGLLKEESTGDVPEELINPVHRLWSEPSQIDPATGLPTFIIDRITLWPEGEGESKDGCESGCGGERSFLVESPKVHLNGEMEILRKLYQKAGEVFRAEDANDLNRLVEAHYGRAIRSAYRRIAKEHDAVVVEGYSDAALPAPISGLDLVVGVEPWRISVFDPERYRNAVRLSAPAYSAEVSTGRVTELLRPTRVVEYQPSSPHERVDRLKEMMDRVLEGS